MLLLTSLQERLIGQHLPDIALPATSGQNVSLATLWGTTVLYAYPRTSPPGGTPIPGWDQIPGAKGCTPQACGFRDQYADLLAAGAPEAGLQVLGEQDLQAQLQIGSSSDALPGDRHWSQRQQVESLYLSGGSPSASHCRNEAS